MRLLGKIVAGDCCFSTVTVQVSDGNVNRVTLGQFVHVVSLDDKDDKDPYVAIANYREVLQQISTLYRGGESAGDTLQEIRRLAREALKDGHS